MLSESEYEQSTESVLEEESDIDTNIPIKNKIVRMMWAAGDSKDPIPETVNSLLRFIENIISIIFDEVAVVQLFKHKQKKILKKSKFKRILLYLEHLFPVETCVFFSSIEFKVKNGHIIQEISSCKKERKEDHQSDVHKSSYGDGEEYEAKEI